MVTRQGELGHVELAEDDGTRCFQALHDGGIGAGDVLPQNPRGTAGANPLGGAQILNRDRNPMQRPAIVAALDLCRGRLRLGQSPLGKRRQVAVQDRIDAFDASKDGLGQLDR